MNQCIDARTYFFVLLGITLLFWFIHFIRRTIFFLYFWQLKEYRIDRFVEEVKRRKKIIFSKFSFLALLAFLLYFVPTKDSSIWVSIVALLYVLFGTYSVFLLLRRKWIFPHFTKKMLLFFAFTLGLEILLLWEFSSNFFLFIIVFEFLLPVFIFLCLQIIQIPVVFVKKRIIKRAKARRRELPELTTIGITGSYGKTSTKEILFALLSRKNETLETSVHVNTEMGVAKTVIDFLKKGHKFFICEMAAYKKGEVGRISKMVKPKIGILTGINGQHLALFGSQNNIIQAKYELIESLPSDGLAVFNGDNRYCLELYKKTDKPKMIYGLQEKIGSIDSDIWAKNIKTEKDASSFEAVCRDGERAEFKIKLLGKYSILNILGAISVAKYLGMELREMPRICSSLEAKLGGMVLEKGINGLDIIDSSYSANPTGVISALEHLKLWEGKRVVVMPSLIELGRSSRQVHIKIGEKINEICDLAIITTKDELNNIKKGISDTEILYIPNPGKIAQKIKEFCSSGDVILLEGRVPKSLIKKLTTND